MYAVILSTHWVQVYVSTEVAAEFGGLKALTSTGTSILVQGTLRRTPEGTLQVRASVSKHYPSDSCRITGPVLSMLCDRSCSSLTIGKQ